MPFKKGLYNVGGYRHRKMGRLGYARKKKSGAYRKSVMIARIPRTLNLQVHYFKQTYFPSATALSNTGGSYSASNGILQGPTANSDMGFSLKILASDIPQFASFAALFDAYKIAKVVVKFVPQTTQYTMVSNPGSTPVTTTAQQQYLNTAIDLDDSSIPTSLQEIMEYETFLSTPAYKNHKRVFVPRMSQLAFKTSGTTVAYTQAYPELLFYNNSGKYLLQFTSNSNKSVKNLNALKRFLKYIEKLFSKHSIYLIYA